MSDNLSSDEARRQAARQRLQQRQARAQQNGSREEGRVSASARTDSSERAAAGPQRASRSVAAEQRPRVRRDGSQVQSSMRSDSTRTSATRQGAATRTQASAGSTAGVAGAGQKIVGALQSAGAAIANAFQQLVARYGTRNTIIGLAAAVVLIIVLACVIKACTTPVTEEQQALNEADQAVSQAEFTNEDETKPDQAALANLLGADVAAGLLNAASTNQEAYWIAAHPDSYTTDGDGVLYKILKLAADEPEAITFVRNWPDKYPQDSAESSTGTVANNSTNAVPQLYQWDPSWGYTVYSSTSFAVTGCCPTSLAMVYQGLTGNTDRSPYDMGQLARELGYETEYDGTSADFLIDAAGQLGLNCSWLSAVSTNITAPLEAGQVLIINVGPGDFTSGGHFIVATGIADNGQVIINDPYSAERSSRTWDVDTLVSQTKAIYSYSLA